MFWLVSLLFLVFASCPDIFGEKMLTSPVLGRQPQRRLIQRPLCLCIVSSLKYNMGTMVCQEI